MVHIKGNLVYALLIASFSFFVDPAVVACLSKENAVPEAVSEKGQPDTQEESGDAAPERKIPQLGPGTWEPLFEIGESIYPSVAIGTATLKQGPWDDQQHIGDPWGTIGIAVRGTEDNCPVTAEISGGNFVRPSTFAGTLADKDAVYCVYPNLKYEYEKLLNVKQTVPETLSFKVTIGKNVQPEKVVRIQVRPVNECVYYFVDSAGTLNDVSFFFAAYVNENHPFISQILKEAIDAKRVDSFSGYSDDRDSVRTEIEAIWNTLRKRGMHYSAMPASADDDNPYLESQYVRLLGESVHYAQANCVDGSVLMASIFRKIGLDASLIAVPEHMFVAVNLDPEGKETIFIETTMLGNSSLDEAIETGHEQYVEGKDKFDSGKEEDMAYHIINSQGARTMGIIPIKDSSADEPDRK